MPDFDPAPDSYCKVSARRSKLEGCDRVAEGEMIYGDSAGYIRENSTAFLVYSEEKVPARVES